MLKNKNYNNFFFYWLLTIIFLIITMIVVGGLTRLTNSGLSITSWDLITGIVPPLSNEDWNKFFDLYKEIPQYILINNDISLNEFKFIFLWEYFHRLLGRFIGLVYLLPFVYLFLKNALSKETSLKLAFYFMLILIQGFFGWYMVKSGLIENVSVSHYRLSIHLGTAFILLSCLVWMFMNFRSSTTKIFLDLSRKNLPIKILLLFLGLQIIMGAFVSGLDAGKIYQTWPLMNETYFPNDVTNKDLLKFNNHSVVQFYHRNLAYIILFISLYIGIYIFKNKKNILFKPYFIYLAFIVVQIIIGIFTLLSGVEIYIASLHQLSSIFLLISALNLYHQSISA
jgi:cytochrome c oxidase assembly protein subunit 15